MSEIISLRPTKKPEEAKEAKNTLKPVRRPEVKKMSIDKDTVDQLTDHILEKMEKKFVTKSEVKELVENTIQRMVLDTAPKKNKK